MYLLNRSLGNKHTKQTGSQRGELHTWQTQTTASSLHLDLDGGFSRLWVAIETLNILCKQHRRFSSVISTHPLSATTILHTRHSEAVRDEVWGQGRAKGDRSSASFIKLTGKICQKDENQTEGCWLASVYLFFFFFWEKCFRQIRVTLKYFFWWTQVTLWQHIWIYLLCWFSLFPLVLVVSAVQQTVVCHI